MSLLVVLLVSAPAHAGWLRDFCERHIVMDDPYEAEHYATAWIERQIQQIEIRRAWGKATRQDMNRLCNYEAVLRMRQTCLQRLEAAE